MRKKLFDGNTIRDLSMLLFLACTFAATAIIPLAPQDRQLVYQLLIAVQFLGAVLGFFGRVSLCVVLGGTQVAGWAAYRLFSLYSAGIPLVAMDYVWLLLPLISALSVMGFQSGSARLERENTMLHQQVEDLVMVDPLTGLYNLRTLYREIPVMIHYCDRNSLDLSLLIVRQRYEQELKAILPANRYSQLCQRMAELVADHLRVEDKVFAIGDGAFALLVACNLPGTDVVKNRVRSYVEDPKAFAGIVDDNIFVSVRIGGKQYNKDEYQDPISFKQSVESELAYDV